MKQINTILDRFRKGVTKEQLEEIEALEYFTHHKDQLEEKVSIYIIFTLQLSVDEEKWEDFYSGELWEIEYEGCGCEHKGI